MNTFAKLSIMSCIVLGLIVTSGCQSSGVDQRPSPDSTQGAGQSEPPSPTPSSSPVRKPSMAIHASEAYSDQRPSLMAITLGQSKQSVIERYSMPVRTFVMNDPDEEITVYDYGSFSVGFSPDNIVRFVHVQSAELDPGLHGIRIGTDPGLASEMIRKPDSENEYAIVFLADEAVLKLDIDPGAQLIHSIKLFAVHDKKDI